MQILDKSRFNQLVLAFIPLSFLMLLTLVLPYGQYTYDRIVYQMTGLQFFTGKLIMGGSVYVPPMKLLWFAVLLSVVAIAAVLFKKLFSIKTLGKIMLAVGFLELVVGIMFIFLIKSTLSETKKPAIEFGVFVLMLSAGLFLSLAVYILFQLKYLSALDFMVLAGVAYLLINNYLPLIGISIAFKRIDYSVGIWKSEWTGFDNFKYLFQSSDAYIITRNTLLYNIVFIILGNITGILAGIALSEVFSKRLQKSFQTLILLPQLISMVIVAYIVFGFLSNEAGFINKTFLSDSKINFYSEQIYWPFILVFVHIWKGLGYSAIIYLSAIIGIDHNLYEAARIDGAGRLRVITSITLPLIKPTVYTLTMLQVGRIFYSDFGLFYQVPMNSGPLYTVTNTIDTYVYRALMTLNNLAMASAASAYQAIVGFVLVLGVNLAVRMRNKENALF